MIWQGILVFMSQDREEQKLFNDLLLKDIVTSKWPNVYACYNFQFLVLSSCK